MCEWNMRGKRTPRDEESLAGAQLPASKGTITTRQDLSQLYQKTVTCKQNHENSWLQDATEVSVKLFNFCD